MHRHYVCAVLPPEPAVVDGTKEILVLDDDDHQVFDVRGNPVTETIPNVVKQALPQRAKIHPSQFPDLRRSPARTDVEIPTGVDGISVRRWCLVWVDAPSQKHRKLVRDAEIWPLDDTEGGKTSVRVFLSKRGEIDPPDTPESCFVRLYQGQRETGRRLRAG